MILLVITAIIAVPVWVWVVSARPVSSYREALIAHAREQAPMVIADLDRVTRIEIRRARTIEWQAGGMVSPAEATTEAMNDPGLQGVIDGAKDKRTLKAFTRELRATLGNEKRIVSTSIGGPNPYGIRLYLDDGCYYDCSFRPSDPNPA